MADSAIGETEKRPICIVGAGLVGSMLAVVLQKQGFQVTVYERYPDMTTIPSLSRSINLIMTRRGLLSEKKIVLNTNRNLFFSLSEVAISVITIAEQMHKNRDH